MAKCKQGHPKEDIIFLITDKKTDGNEFRSVYALSFQIQYGSNEILLQRFVKLNIV